MPLEGAPTNPEPERSPDSEKTLSEKPSPVEEQKLKEEGEKSVPETPAVQLSPDDSQGAEDDGKSIPKQPVSGLNVEPRYGRYLYDSDSSDDEGSSTDDDVEVDEFWINCYSAESDPHWIAIRDACGLLMENARKAVANYSWRRRLDKTSWTQSDTNRLTRLTSHLTILNEDVEELAVSTTPQCIASDSELATLMRFIRFLSEMGPERQMITVKDKVRGKMNWEGLASWYRAYKNNCKEVLRKETESRLKACQCIHTWETHRGAFIGYYKETKALHETRGVWMKVQMSEKDLKTWNTEMRKLARAAQKLLQRMEVIVRLLIPQLKLYFESRKLLKKGLSDLLCLEVPLYKSSEKNEVEVERLSRPDVLK